MQLFEQIDLRNVVGEARFANISTEAGPKPLILIADDEKDLVNALEEFFEKSGYAVATAYNGVEAIEKINREKREARSKRYASYSPEWPRRTDRRHSHKFGCEHLSSKAL